jgi:hypothetical protein
MELIAAVLFAGPLGYFARRGLLFYLAVWAIIFPVQTVQVVDGPGDWSYFVVNAVILAFGIKLNRIGHGLRAKRSGAGPDANEPAVTGPSAA